MARHSAGREYEPRSAFVDDRLENVRIRAADFKDEAGKSFFRERKQNNFRMLAVKLTNQSVWNKFVSKPSN